MEQEVAVQVAALMTAPRYETNFARNVISNALFDCGLKLNCSGGVFYGQCMQLMLEDLIEGGKVDYALTVDFDSLFTAKDVRRLLRWMIEKPEIDAITGVQVRRGKPVVLGTIPKGNRVQTEHGPQDEIEWDGNPILATTAHFGLTVLDLKKLANVQKPWFFPTWDENGSWRTDTRKDDDVNFWLRWKESGNTVYLDPGVRIGHLEEMVSTYDEDMTPVHMYPNDWLKANAG